MIQAAQRGGDLRHRALQRGRVGDVGRGGGDRDAAGLEPPRGRGQPGLVPGDEADGRALGGERLGHREADAPAAPGDQHAPAAQAQVHGWLLSPGWQASRQDYHTGGGPRGGGQPRA